MNFGYSETCLEHDPGERHPETADRLLAIRRRLTKSFGVAYVDADPASVDELTAVHDPDYVDAVREFCDDGGGNWDPDTVAVEGTWDAALASAGLACWAAEAALDGQQGRDAPFSLGRPPGHHAVADDAMGFCFFNNAAVAAQSVLDSGEAERVAIVDWDVHHGNGTQAIFDDRADVFYASLHEEGLYPGTGAVDQTGRGAGKGTTFNAALPAGVGDPGYLYVLREVLSPALIEYDPDLLFVSAGFDAHRHDPISRMRLSTEGFGHLTVALREASDAAAAPIAFVLEGGYGLDTLADGVAMVHDVFDGYEPVGPDGDPSEGVLDLAERLRELHDIDPA